MKTFHTVAAIAALAIGGAVTSVGSNAPNRPPGVSASDWAPISDIMGVVLIGQQMAALDAPILTQGATSGRAVIPGAGAGGGAALIAPATGYLMVKRGHEWERLIIVEPIKGPGDAG